MFTEIIIYLLYILYTCRTYPYNGYMSNFPQKAVMVGSFYDQPVLDTGHYPKAGMSAFAAGDTILTQSFLDEQNKAENNQDQFPYSNDPKAQLPPTALTGSTKMGSLEEPSKDADTLEEPSADDKTGSTKKDHSVPQAVPESDQKGETDTDNDEISDALAFWRFAKQRRNDRPAYNTFFPVIIGGGDRRRATKFRDNTYGVEDEEEGYPLGTATAIANSFSTGKGGIASSHATSFGEPYMSALFRRRNYSNKV